MPNRIINVLNDHNSDLATYLLIKFVVFKFWYIWPSSLLQWMLLCEKSAPTLQLEMLWWQDTRASLAAGLTQTSPPEHLSVNASLGSSASVWGVTIWMRSRMLDCLPLWRFPLGKLWNAECYLEQRCFPGYPSTETDGRTKERGRF